MHDEMKLRTVALKQFSKEKEKQPEIQEPPILKRYKEDIKAMGDASALLALSSSTSSDSSSSSSSSSSSGSSSSSDSEQKPKEKKE